MNKNNQATMRVFLSNRTATEHEVKNLMLELGEWSAKKIAFLTGISIERINNIDTRTCDLTGREILIIWNCVTLLTEAIDKFYFRQLNIKSKYNE